MANLLTIRFEVTGTCTQTIKLADNCPYSKQEIVNSLNGDGDAICTTVHENGELICFSDNDQAEAIGKIIGSDIDAEYTEFEEVDCLGYPLSSKAQAVANSNANKVPEISPLVNKLENESCLEHYRRISNLLKDQESDLSLKERDDAYFIIDTYLEMNKWNVWQSQLF